MKFVRYERSGKTGFGVLEADTIFDLQRASAGAPSPRLVGSLADIIAGGQEALDAVRSLMANPVAARLPLSEATLLAPLAATPHNAYCVGRNYLEHVAEGDRIRGVATTTLPEYPQFFTKGANAFNGPTADIPLWSATTQQLDYEVELAIIIGRGGRDIAKADAAKHIFGYTIANDVSARDLQRRHGQWFKGKSLDGSLPFGPCIVTADAIPDPGLLRLELHVNGERRQSALASEMIFDIPTIIEHLSAGLTLSPGDLILTGTPSGVGAAMTPPAFLRDGDEVVCSISGIGELRNRVVDMGRGR